MNADTDAMALMPPDTEPASGGASSLAARFDSLLMRLGDRLNAILVKETRQALKSRQFVVTFALVLLFGWAWSLLGVALIGPDVSLTSNGPGMFFGYYVILAFPLLVVVPYGAFRSIAAEQEERTYEMLSITAMGPRQIIWGKLGSAVLQMLVYLSAITPCLAFTYMLRGISVPMILFIVFYTALASVCLSMICIFLGAMAAEKYLQVIVSVLAVIGLFLAFWGICALAMEILQSPGVPFDRKEFWIGNAALLTLVFGYFVLVFEAAAARVTFAADNRSTRLRVVMVLQFVLFCGWMALAFIDSHFDDERFFVFMILGGLHWFVMGTMMIGEQPMVSLRVRRRLPRSHLGRVFLTWFNPGPGTGYVFAVAGLMGVMLLAVAGVACARVWPDHAMRFGRNSLMTVLCFGFLGLCYTVFFLGLCLIIIRGIRRFSSAGIMTAILLQGLLVMFFCLVPLIVHYTSPTYRQIDDYTVFEIGNAIYTLAYIADQGMPIGFTHVLLTVVPVAALLVLIANVPGLAKELAYVRVVAPERVLEEDAELAAQPAKTQARSAATPWDDKSPDSQE